MTLRKGVDDWRRSVRINNDGTVEIHYGADSKTDSP